MSIFINSTERYHREEMDSLGWELTVCEMLAREDSPCRRILKTPRSLGSALHAFLSDFFPWDSAGTVLEVGGGYGSLMRDLCAAHPGLRPTMLDISPFLHARQREALTGTGADFLVGDFFECGKEFLGGFDLAIFNENLGDFPTVCGITPVVLRGKGAVNDTLQAVRRLFARYGLERPAAGSFAFNLGAVLAVQMLCEAGVPRIYMSEHSCQAHPPREYDGLIHVPFAGSPERIRLRGHDEYTIRFSHLEAVARAHGYRTHRGPYADFLEFEFTPEIRFILASHASAKDEHEVIRQFVEDLFKYEYLVLLKKTP
jgi:hypothetical protein